MGRVWGIIKRTGRDEPIIVVIHTCMETTQRNSLYSYLYLKLAKTPCFSYLSCFFFYKIREQVGTGGRWEVGGERDKRINTEQIIYTHVSK
jgi:hypothetical protein